MINFIVVFLIGSVLGLYLFLTTKTIRESKYFVLLILSVIFFWPLLVIVPTIARVNFFVYQLVRIVVSESINNIRNPL
jgi:hypothetical protein